MNNGANEAVQTPGGVMLAAGGVLALFYAVSALWNGVGLMLGCMGTGFSGLAVVNGDGDAMVMGFQMWALILSCIAFIVYIGLAAGGAYVATGGMAMRSLEDLPKVRRSVMLAAVLPITGLLMNGLTSLLAFSCCGLFVGSIPQLIVTGVGCVAAYLAHTALQDDSVVSAFKS